MSERNPDSGQRMEHLIGREGQRVRVTMPVPDMWALGTIESLRPISGIVAVRLAAGIYYAGPDRVELLDEAAPRRARG